MQRVHPGQCARRHAPLRLCLDHAVRLAGLGRGQPLLPVVAIALGLLVPVDARPAERAFAAADIADWETHSFEGNTRYELEQVDDREAVRAACEEETSSGLFWRRGVDLRETPVIEWRWRVDRSVGDVDETERSGDDFAARIYVVDEHQVFRWRTRALSYVWSSDQPEGADWPNPYADQVHMVAVDSGSEHTGVWRTHWRNLREDFKRYHDRELDEVDAVAIMTDCDDSGRDTEAFYGEIRLLPG